MPIALLPRLRLKDHSDGLRKLGWVLVDHNLTKTRQRLDWRWAVFTLHLERMLMKRMTSVIDAIILAFSTSFLGTPTSTSEHMSMNDTDLE